jgi:hypothetical protein
MERNLADNLSYIIKLDGTIIPAMPDDEEFSIQQIRDYVAGPPEAVCETQDGYILFHNREGESRELPPNRFATSVYVETTQQERRVLGRAFLAHPNHIAMFWRTSAAGA